MKTEAELESLAKRICYIYKDVGMRFTPLHHRAMPVCVRFTTWNSLPLRSIKANVERDGWKTAGPFVKLDGARYLEVYAV